MGMMLVVSVVLVVLGPLVTAEIVGGAGAGLDQLTTAVGTGPSAAAAAVEALSPIPSDMLALYRRAATGCPGLSWTVLAAIGTVESGNGTSTLPGVDSGANSAGAEGPMQFEPATFARYDQPVPPGGISPPSPYNPVDAIYAAARYLCANGGRGSTDLAGAVYAYNHLDSYVTEVLSLAQQYGAAASTPAPTGDPAGVAVGWALSQIGTPYVWGGETPGVGFDCSGLVQAAYRAAAVALPRTAQGQYDAGPKVAAGAPLQAGDLVFFGGGPAAVSHVGIFLGLQDGQAWMVDAPHSGALVRVEPFPAVVGAMWGTDRFVGATRPGDGPS